MARGASTAPVVESFERSLPRLPGSRLRGMRGRAIRKFAAAGFPTARSEAWKYTSLDRLARTTFDPLAERRAVDMSAWTGVLVAGASRFVLANGRFDAGASTAAPPLPEGVVLAPLAAALEDSEEDLDGVVELDGAPLAALNAAFMQDGLLLELPPGAELDRPVQLLHVVDAGICSHPRVVVIAGENSRATLVETFVGRGREVSWTNAVTEIRAAAGASVAHVKLQAEGPRAFHTALARAALGPGASYAGTALGTGAALSRNEIRISCDGADACCGIRGGLLLRGRQHGDSTTEVAHRASGASSRQVFRHVLDGSARSVFQGGILVAEEGQKTDASQSSRSLLLSEGARADAKPELRILADDVRCAHGATAGDLDADALFYLQSRGLDRAEARALLIEAFVGEVVDGAPEGAARDHLAAAVSAWMAGEGGE